MTEPSAVATASARRLWARAAGGATSPPEVAAAVEQMCELLSAGLGRWIGVAGYRALLRRAVGVAVEESPALEGFACLGGTMPVTPAAIREGGSREVIAGVTTLVATLIDLLGGIVGEDMAVRLVEQAGMPGPRLVVNTDLKRGRNA